MAQVEMSEQFGQSVARDGTEARKRVLNTKLIEEEDNAEDHEGGAEVKNDTVNSDESADGAEEENINEE